MVEPMNHTIDLLAIQTPEHLREGLEHQTRFDGGLFEVNIFETFQSSTKVRIQYAGLSISSMIRGYKIVYGKDGRKIKFTPGTSLVLPAEEQIYADFPEADARNPVQCATILIPKETVERLMLELEKQYPEGNWQFDFANYHFQNDSAFVRAINELLQLASEERLQIPLSEVLLKSLFIRLLNAQREYVQEQTVFRKNNPMLQIKQYIQEHIDQDLSLEKLMEIGNCSKSTLHRLFESYCSKTPGAYILQERMLLASNLLLHPEFSISDVAYKTGFSSLSYFAKQFRTFHGCTAGDFKKKFGH
ncbi:hypothetical protein GCM10022216_01210 [Sphingobacterium kyonggiense]|uniref:HTH araC/xylS-type domain-containing protein n=2 Tax=Sphingobacterium kyonggiense TaxID=714075 RepID=A0ABP7Y6F8_9SPHI